MHAGFRLILPAIFHGIAAVAAILPVRRNPEMSGFGNQVTTSKQSQTGTSKQHRPVILRLIWHLP